MFIQIFPSDAAHLLLCLLGHVVHPIWDLLDLTTETSLSS